QLSPQSPSVSDSRRSRYPPSPGLYRSTVSLITPHVRTSSNPPVNSGKEYGGTTFFNSKSGILCFPSSQQNPNRNVQQDGGLRTVRTRPTVFSGNNQGER